VPEATVALPLTKSLALARRRLESVPLSGQTPLADALRLGRRLLRQELFKHPNAVPLLVAVTDGRPTVALRTGGDPLADALTEARRLRRAGVACVVADTDGRGHADDLAAAAGGISIAVASLARETIVAALAGPA
jgi:magnesium chelatase subunit D